MMRQCPKQSKSYARGFTLIEIMVVAGIVAVIFPAMFFAFDRTLSLANRMEQENTHYQSLLSMMLFMENDLRYFIDRDVSNAYGDVKYAFAMDLEDLDDSDDLIAFTTSRADFLYPDVAIPQRVVWRLDDESRLIRKTWRVLDLDRNSEPTQVKFLDEVNSVSFEIVDPKGVNINNQSAQNTANNPNNKPIPKALQMTITLKDGFSLSRTMQLVSAQRDI